MKESTHLKIFYVFAAFSIVLIMCALLFSNIEKIPVNVETVYTFNDNWKYKPIGKKEIILTLPSTIPDVNVDTPFAITNILPEHFVSGMTLCIRTSQQTLRVFVDGQLLYENGLKEKRLFGNSPGSGYHFIRIPNETEGKLIRLEFTTPYINNYNYVGSITYGSKASNIFQLLSDHLFSFVICILICMFGFLFILIYHVTKKKIEEDRSLLYLGMFAIIVSIWSSTETRMLQFLFGNAYLEHLITFLSLTICPIIFLLFLRTSSHIKLGKVYSILYFASIFNFVLIHALQLAHVADYLESLPVTLTLIFFVITFTLFISMKQILLLKNKSSYILGFGILLLCFFSLLDLIRYIAGPYADCSLYFRIGLLLFILLVGFELCMRIFEMIELGINAKALEKLAYIDVLTQISNRTAFDNAMVKYEELLSMNTNITLIMFDLNYLKRINDTCGHNAGDTILMNAAQCIKEATKEYGTCYRIGGDEFAAIIKEATQKDILKIYENLNCAINNFNKNSKLILSIAYGEANYDGLKDSSLFATLERADKKMYEHKVLIKSRTK